MSDKSRELESRALEYATDLFNQLQNGATDRLLEFMQFAGRFHKYSLNNQMLIWSQCPHATHVASFKAWLKMGNPVKKGSKGINIIVPYKGVRKDASGDEVPYMTFGSGCVFDISQTENPGMAVPTLFEAQGDDLAGLLDTMVAAVEKDGITVEYKDTEAMGTSYGGRISLKPGQDANNTVLTLAHEWSHEIRRRDMAWWREHKYGVGECYAEGSAYIVGRHFGVDCTYSSDYIINWGNTPVLFQQHMGEIVKDAKYIIERTEHELR